ncbi:putative DNA-binding transcriptional regulator YafY [Kribbella amoyensis]|uniref:Putative DNA-binding transcriptional regulator YafY n=1 Tax=Kribbella amoyensis TaxID=996641 RepID=A0A561B2N9_9ACTN|nr:WYL domain-containing protein [Kribbella amoyensis]TWD73129.1 putative DNA-binding transcriptional regulator YafY [Kribbella amoyensis]
MRETSSRVLSLLALLQTRPAWTGTELAERLGVSTRTIRNDVDRLRELGYPVDATRGPSGHYQLGVGAKLPPLLLDDEEAVAVAVGLRTGAGVTGMEESSTRALAKLEQVLPHRLRRQVNAIHSTMSKGPDNTGSNVKDPEVAPGVLTAIAAAIRDEHYLRFGYEVPADAINAVLADAVVADGAIDTNGQAWSGSRPEGWPLLVEPYRLVSWQRYWYLVARDEKGDWRTYRVDWMDLRMPTGRRYQPRPMPDDDYTDFVLRDVASTGWKVHARITVFASAEEVLSRIHAAVGIVESVDENTSVLITGADSLEVVAVYIGMLGLDFQVTAPPALVTHLETIGTRYLRAIQPKPSQDAN